MIRTASKAFGVYWHSLSRWAAYYRLPDGKLKYLYGPRGDRSDQARDAVIGEVKRRCAAIDMASDRILMADLLDFWLGQVERTCKPSTVSNYRVLTEKIRPVLGKKITDAVSHADVAGLLATIDSPYQRNRVLMVLRQAFRLAIGTGKAKVDPTAMIKNARVETKRRTALTEQQAADLLASVRHDPWWHAAVSVLTKIGLRRGELLALTWDRLDLDAGTIEIEQNLTAVRGRKVLDTPKTKSSDRTVPIGEACVQALAKLREHAGHDVETGYVFANLRTGSASHPDSFTRRFKKIAALAGFPDLDVHSLRTSAATIALKNGAPYEVVQRNLGHGSVQVLLDHYRETSMDERRALATAMDRFIPDTGEKIVAFPGGRARKAATLTGGTK